LHQKDVGVGEPLQRRLQRRILHAGDVAQQSVREVASNHGTDLRHLARRPEPIKPGR
jgi:hypothetical protein